MTAVPSDNDAANAVPIRWFPNLLGSLPLKNRLAHANRRGRRAYRPVGGFAAATVGADRMSRLTWFTLCAITWFTPSVVGVYQKVSSFKCVNTFVNINPPYAEFSKNQGNLSLGTGFTHSDFFSTKSLT